MKVLHVAYSDVFGGAARAAYRIHRSLVEYGNNHNITSGMRVLDKRTRDSSVYGGRPSKEFFLWPALRQRLIQKQFRSYKVKSSSFTISRFPTGLGKELNASDADVLNLHFLGNDTLSIEEIGSLNKPLVWRLPDMWAFCGAEHYVDVMNDETDRFRYGYLKTNNTQPSKDFNRKVWKRKYKSWQKPIHIVSPTNWLADCVRKSYLMKNWPVTVIPTAIDLQLWKPKEKSHIRYALGLPLHVPIILFGAMGGTADPRKGGDLLFEALGKLKSLSKGTSLENIELVVFGQSKPDKENGLDFPVHYMGHLNDDITLSMLYAAADVMIIPSRQDNLPGTAIESLACGTPVVSFDIGGLPDLIAHKQNGWMAKPFDTTDMAEGILWILSDKERYSHLSKKARTLAEERYHANSIASKYAALYHDILNHSMK